MGFFLEFPNQHRIIKMKKNEEKVTEFIQHS